MMHKSLYKLFLSVLLLAFAALGLAQSPVFTYYGNVVPTPQNTSPQFIPGATPQNSVAAVSAAAVPSSAAQAIVVSRQATAATVTLTLDRGDSTTSASYSTGESIGVSVSTDQDGYLYIFESTAANAARLVYPPTGDTNVPNRVRAGFTYSLPPSGYDYLFTVGDAFGWNRVTAVVSATPLTDAEVARLSNASLLTQSTITAASGAYGAGSEQFYLNAISTTTFAGSELPGVQTAARTIAPVISNPQTTGGAAIYVQNANFTTNNGRSFTATSGGATYNINVYTLANGAQVGLVDMSTSTSSAQTGDSRISVPAPAPTVNTGTLQVRSNNIGASVYVDGVFIGQIPATGQLDVGSLSFGNHELIVGASGYSTEQISFRLDNALQYHIVNLSALSASVPATQVQRNAQARVLNQAPASTACNTTYGHINVNTSLNGVQIFVNGAPMAVTPLRANISLPPNTYSVTLRRDGMTDFTQNVTINCGQTEFIQLP